MHTWPVGRRSFSLAAAAALAGLTVPLHAATPKDTLVLAMAFDGIISLDPAVAFEISAGELMGNGHDRLIRYGVNDPSPLLPDLARSWSVSADGKTFSFELKPGLRFAIVNPLTAEDVAFSLRPAARRAAGQDTGLHTDAVRPEQGQRQEPGETDRPADADP